jgi:tetratricopeptide (TPR) repeat protein
MPEHLITIEEARENLLACAAYLAENIRSSDGRAEVMKRVVPFYLAKNKVDLAAQFADTVDDPFTRDQLLTMVAEKCAAIDDDEYALQLAEAIEDHGMQAQAREKIALQKSGKGDYEKASEIAETLEHPEYAFADIAVHYAAAGQDENAARMIARIEYENAKVSALRAIAAEKINKGEHEAAIPFLDQATLAANEIEHTEEKIRALTEIGNFYVEAKRNGLAIETLDKAKSLAEKLENVHRDNFLASIAHGLLRAGSLDLADRALDLVGDKTQISACLAAFSREFWSRGETAEAIETLEEAYAVLKSERDSETRNSRAKYGLFSTIAVEFAKFEKPERALEIAQNNVDETERVSALTQIAQVFTGQEKDELARQAINAIEEDSARMFALIGVSDVKNRAGKKDEAIALLSEAAHLAETVPQLASRSSAYNELAKRFIDYGEYEKARAVSHENLENIAQIRDESSRASALANLSEIYESGKFDLTAAEKEIIYTLIRRAEW